MVTELDFIGALFIPPASVVLVVMVEPDEREMLLLIHVRSPESPDVLALSTHGIAYKDDPTVLLALCNVLNQALDVSYWGYGVYHASHLVSFRIHDLPSLPAVITLEPDVCVDRTDKIVVLILVVKPNGRAVIEVPAMVLVDFVASGFRLFLELTVDRVLPTTREHVVHELRSVSWM